MNVLAKLHNGQPINIAYPGGSITAAAGWRGRLAKGPAGNSPKLFVEFAVNDGRAPASAAGRFWYWAMSFLNDDAWLNRQAFLKLSVALPVTFSTDGSILTMKLYETTRSIVLVALVAATPGMLAVEQPTAVDAGSHIEGDADQPPACTVSRRFSCRATRDKFQSLPGMWVTFRRLLPYSLT